MADFIRFRRQGRPPRGKRGSASVYLDAAGAFKSVGEDGTLADLGGAGGGSSPVNVARIKLGDAEIKALPSTPQRLVAGISGEMVWPLQTLLIANLSAGGYNNITPDEAELGIAYTGNPAQTLPGNFIGGDLNPPEDYVNDLLGGGQQNLMFGSILPAAGLASAGSITTGYAVGWGDGAPYDGLDLELQFVNPDGDLTDGGIGNSLIVACVYVLLGLA